MNFDQYIVSFIGGSSGRFVTAVLNSLILNDNDPIRISGWNSAHEHNPFKGISVRNPNHPYIFETFKFENKQHEKPHSYILQTHTFPKFDLINRRFTNLGIIIISLETSDLKEVWFNGNYKNAYRIPKFSYDGREMVCFNVSKFKSENLNEIKYKNCLILPYQSIYSVKDENFELVELLKEFTGITTVPNAVFDACRTYIANRNTLIKQYNLR